MEINVLIDEGLEGCPEAGWLESMAGKVLAAQGVGPDAEMGLVIATEERIRELNRTYLGKDEPTDVISFHMLPAEAGSGEGLPPFVAPPDGISHLGEVIISFPQAVAQAEEHGHTVEREMTILIIHGILHLLGYDDEEPVLKERMSAREREVLGEIG